MNYHQLLATTLYEILGEHLTLEEITVLIEVPKFQHQGDLAFPCFQLAKKLRQSPAQIAKEFAPKISSDFIEKTEALGPYLNFFLNRALVSTTVLNKIITLQENYGNQDYGCGETAVIDFSSPNIAKPFSMGHLRSTVIGNSLRLILQKCGYQTIAINHVGDWGTQFGKLMVACTLWGTKANIEKNPIQELFKLYVKFHEEAKENPQLILEGRAWFKKLELGDAKATELWDWFRTESLTEFSRIYELLGIEFDSYHGEAFYNEKIPEIIEILKEKELLVESEGAQVVVLNDEEMPPCLIKKNDGATLYATRDLAAALYRQRTYKFKRALYVVGQEQSLHFKQLFSVLRKMDYTWVNGMDHIPFGLILKDGKKMSTRKGKVVLLNEVIQEAIALALAIIQSKNPNLINQQEVAKAVGVGAIIFHDLKNERLHSVEFSLEQMLKFEGETGPYIQYTHARACSLLRKANYSPNPINLTAITDLESWNVIKELEKFPQIISQAFSTYEPSHLAKYTIDLAQAFNKFYGKVHILEDDFQKQNRLSLTYSVTIVLKEGLRLLGIMSPEEM